MAATFHEQFVGLFEVHYRRIFRYLNRLTGDADLAADVAQETFMRLYRRASLPDRPEAWLVSVALNLFRNESNTRRRRNRLLTLERGARVHSDPGAAPDSVVTGEPRARVRDALDRIPERDRQMLLLRAEGYSYRDIASTLGLHEASIGVQLARAKRAFLDIYEGSSDASH